MGEAITFAVTENFGTYYATEEASGRNAAWYNKGARDRAQKHADYLNREHANGRVAQAHCSHGHACDFDRVNDPTREVPATERASLILCADHAKVIK